MKTPSRVQLELENLNSEATATKIIFRTEPALRFGLAGPGAGPRRVTTTVTSRLSTCLPASASAAKLINGLLRLTVSDRACLNLHPIVRAACYRREPPAAWHTGCPTQVMDVPGPGPGGVTRPGLMPGQAEPAGGGRGPLSLNTCEVRY